MVVCPNCSGRFVARARRHGLAELVLGLVTVYPFRCQLCAHRFLAFRGRPTYDSRREYRRIPVRVPVAFDLTVSSSAEGLHGDGTALDLSIKGCALESATPVPGGVTLRLTITLEEATEPINVEHAIVRHIRGNRVGVEFLELKPLDQARLRRAIESRLSRQPFQAVLN